MAVGVPHKLSIATCGDKTRDVAAGPPGQDGVALGVPARYRGDGRFPATTSGKWRLSGPVQPRAAKEHRRTRARAGSRPSPVRLAFVLFTVKRRTGLSDGVRFASGRIPLRLRRRPNPPKKIPANDAQALSNRMAARLRQDTDTGGEISSTRHRHKQVSTWKKGQTALSCRRRTGFAPDNLARFMLHCRRRP